MCLYLAILAANSATLIFDKRNNKEKLQHSLARIRFNNM